jgi:hypothetical protein
MPKFNFSRIQRRERTPRRFELTDPGAPGETMVVTLQPLDDVDAEGAETRYAELERRFVLGGFRHENGFWQDQPAPYPPIGDQPVRLSRAFLQIAARIETMQPPLPPEDRVSFDDLVNMAVLTPHAWRTLQAHASAVQREYDAAGKAPAPVSEAGSEAPPSS